MSSNVAVFPLYRRQRLLSGIAHVLRSKQGEEASLFWRETAKSLLHQLTASGVDRQSAEKEVRDLLHAVVGEFETAEAVR